MFELLIPIYLLLIVIGYICRKKGGSISLYFFTVVIFTFFLALFNPDPSMDLYRYYSMLEKYKVNGIDYALSQYYFKLAPLYPIYFYIISRFDIPHFLIIVTSIISYGGTFYLFNSICKENKITKSATFWGYLSILLFVELMSVTNVRQTIGSVMAMIGCYCVMEKNKASGYILILGGALMHHTLWSVVAAVFIVKLFKNSLIIKLICFVIPVFIMGVLTGIIPLGTWILNLYEKTKYAFFYGLGHQINSYVTRVDNNPTTNILYMISSVVRLLLLQYDRKKYKEKDRIYSLIPLIVMMLGVGLFRIPTADVRFFIIANVINLPILWEYFNRWKFAQDITQNSNAELIIRYNGNKNRMLVAFGIAFSLIAQFVYVFYGQYIRFGSLLMKWFEK